MPDYLARVWLPDRPGALGAVASRIGAVGGDLTGIDILERGAGRAIDELVISLPSEDLLSLLVREMSQVDGVDVEDIRQVTGQLVDPRLDALESAINIVEAHNAQTMLSALCKQAVRDFEADWGMILDHINQVPLTAEGASPDAAWVGAFVRGSRASSLVAGPAAAGPDDVAWADLTGADLVLVLGRKGRPFRARERRQATALVRIADARYMELVRRNAL
jgi:hypothetical protein